MKIISLLVSCGIVLGGPVLLAQQEPIIKAEITTIVVLSGQGSVATVDVTAGGSGYSTAPSVTFAGGGGSGATAKATISGGAVTGIQVTDGGTGYTSAPTITIAAPGATAEATATVSSPPPGAVTGFTITNGGSGYTAAPAITITGGGGSGATATATVTGGSVTAITVTGAGGTGYTANPTITIAPPGTTATATVKEVGTVFRQPFQNESYGPVGTPFNMTALASGTFPVGGFSYNFFVNGEPLGASVNIQPPGGGPGTIGWAPPQPGAYMLTVTASDGAHTANSLAVRYFATGTAIIGPTDNTLVPMGSSVVLQATATPVPSAPNAFVQRMDFYADGVLVGSDNTYPYSYIYTPAASPATHTIEARAFDNNGRQISPDGSATRQLTMVTAIGTPPTVRIVNPTNGSSVPSGSAVSIITEAIAPSGFIKNVDFYLNGVQLTSTQAFPFTASWTPKVPGAYQFVAIAFDDKSNAVASSPITINVTGGFPTVEIASPSAGSTVVQGATLPVTVRAAGPDGGITTLKSIDLLVDGVVSDSLPKAAASSGTSGTTGGTTSAAVLTEPFVFNWRSNVPLGTHRIAARVTDTNNLSITSPELTVNVIPNQPPQVAITAPTATTALAANVGATITAAASDQDGTVDSVEFFVDGTSLGTVTKAPFQMVWTPAGAGTFSLTAKATDNGGVSTTSAPIIVTIDPPPAAGGSLIANTVFRGDYGSPTETGRFALGVNRNNRGTFVAYSTDPKGRTYFWSDFAVNPDGTFSVRDSANQIVLSGQTSATGVSGLFDGKTFIGPITIGTGTFSPMLLTGALAGSPSSQVVAIVGGDGSVTLYSASGTNREAGSDFLTSSGAYTISTPTGGRYTGTVTPTTGVIAGSVSGSVSGTFLLQQQPSRIVNISMRATAGPGERTLVAGFVIRGAGSKPLLVRGVGPTLANFGVASPLADPFLSILSSTGVVATNNDWGNSAALSTAASQVGAFALNAGSRDAAAQVTLAPGVYTAVVEGATSTPGAALVELYDTQSVAGTAKIANISARAQAGANETLVAGFVISGDQRKRLLIRAVGPTLAGFGLTGVLADPKLDVVSGSNVIVSNNDWTDAAVFRAVSSASTSVGAFPLQAGSRDAALVVQLNPGAYTVQVAGNGGTTGTVLIEIYDADL